MILGITDLNKHFGRLSKIELKSGINKQCH